jgi:hypothetical protein
LKISRFAITLSGAAQVDPHHSSGREFIAEHRETAARLFPRGLVLERSPSA